LVLDDFGGRLGRAWRETDEGTTDRQTIIADFMDGQYSDPVRVVAFNSAEGRSREVSKEIADQIARRCALDGLTCHPIWRASSIATAASGRRSCHYR